MNKTKFKDKSIHDKDFTINKVSQVSIAYVHARRRMIEAERGTYYYPDHVLSDSEKIVYHIDSIIESMDERSKLILENEVKLQKTGEWYRDYCSPSTYYRIRDHIYEEFIKELEK